ncbi:hypothetical protein ACTA71_006133 [Dictyostelium dimigraforme]
MIKSLFNKLYSPKNFDAISIKKTKYNILIFFILLLIFIFIIVIVSVKDSKNRLTFVESKIENDLQVPHFFLLSNVSSFSYNILNVENDAIETNFTNGCDFNFLNGNSSCIPNDYFQVTNSSEIFYPYYTPSNITFQKTYIRVISNYLQIPNPSIIEEKSQKIAKIGFHDDLSLFISPPSKVQFLLKKEVYVDRYGTEKVHLSPVLISSSLPLDFCSNLTSGEIIFDCFTVDISILYQTNIVLYYTEETDRQLVTRILADISSISRLVLSLVYIAISFIITRFLFDQKTAWFPNSIRDPILYHLKYYRVQKKLNQSPNQPSLISKIIGKLKKFGNDDNEINLYEERNQYKKLKDEAYLIKKETEGSKIKLKRVFQGIGPQDEDSLNLSKVSSIKLLIFVIIMILISSIIIFKNSSNRMSTTQFENVQILDLPKLNYSFIGTNVYWNRTTEIQPNGESKTCSYFPTDCQSSSNDFPNNTIVANNSVIVNSNSIFMSLNEIFQFNIDFSTILPGMEFLDLNKMIIKLSINEIDHLITPFSNITVLLEKTIFHKFDGTNETMYDTNLIVTFVPWIYDETNSKFDGTSYLNIRYSDNQIRHIYEETDSQLGQRLLQYIMAFSSPLSIIIGFIFTYIIIRLLFKTPSAHCDPTFNKDINHQSFELQIIVTGYYINSN